VSHVSDGRRPTPPPDIEGKAFGVERIVGQPAELLLFHGCTPSTEDASDFDFQVDPGIATGEIADAPLLAVVEASRALPADSPRRFFRRRRKRNSRALGSPKMPRTVFSGSKPGNRYASCRRRGFSIGESWQIPRTLKTEKTRQNGRQHGI